MQICFPIISVFICLAVAGSNAFSFDFDPSGHFKIEFEEIDKNDGKKVVVEVKEVTTHKGSSQEHSTSSNNANRKLQRKQWDSKTTDTGNTKISEIKSKISTDESGSSSTKSETKRGSTRGQRQRGVLTINGQVVISTDKGSSVDFLDTTNSSSYTAFERSLVRNIERQAVQKKIGQCVRQRGVTLYLLVQLSENWRHKLQLVRQLMKDTYKQNQVNIVCAFFNKNVNVVATIGQFPKTSLQQLLKQIDNLEYSIESMTQLDFRSFDLIAALRKCIAYQSLYSYENINLLVSLFDSEFNLESSLISELQQTMASVKSSFSNRLCLLHSGSKIATSGLQQYWKQLGDLMTTRKFAFTEIANLSREQMVLRFMSRMLQSNCGV